MLDRKIGAPAGALATKRGTAGVRGAQQRYVSRATVLIRRRVAGVSRPA
jgi:hypothetical protein